MVPGLIPPAQKLAHTSTHTPEPCLYLGGQRSSPCARLARQGFITHCSSISFAKQHFQTRQDVGCAQAQPPSHHGRLQRAQTQLGSQQPAHPGLCSHLPEPRQLLLPLASIHPSSSYSYCTYFSQEHPQGTSPQCKSIPALLPGPASLLLSLHAMASFTTYWSGAQANHRASSLLLEGET